MYNSITIPNRRTLIMKKVLSILILAAIIMTMVISTSAGSLGQKFENGDVLYVEPGSITIDGLKDPAYNDTCFVETNLLCYNPGGDPESTTSSTRVLWDGTYVYIYSEIRDNTSFNPPLAHILTQCENADCLEYFFVFDNGDCEGIEMWNYDSSYDFYAYRTTCDYESIEGAEGGYFWSQGAERIEGFRNGAEDTEPFRDEEGYMVDGKVVVTAYGFSSEVKIKLPSTNRKGEGSYTYGEGTKIGFMVQQNDMFDALFSHDGYNRFISDPGRTEAGSGSAYEAPYYWYLELKGAPAATDTQAPETTSPSADKNPQTSDLAVAGIAVIATLALAGVVVAKKVR